MARISPNAISKNPDEAAAIMIVIEFPVLLAFCAIVTDGEDKEDKIGVIVILLTGGVLSTVLLILLVVDGIADEESVLNGDVDIIVVVGIEKCKPL